MKEQRWWEEDFMNRYGGELDKASNFVTRDGSKLSSNLISYITMLESETARRCMELVEEQKKDLYSKAEEIAGRMERKKIQHEHDGICEGDPNYCDYKSSESEYTNQALDTAISIVREVMGDKEKGL